ncbi:hypothetical protein [Limnohabitans sp.]|uniref:hypothetical protein n=1 Tax=Limnohabitans sp. TaxID=1907725 RepID=UPI0037C0E9F5
MDEAKSGPCRLGLGQQAAHGRGTCRVPSAAGGLAAARQQLAFAHALMPSPRIMVPDEPIAALAPSLVG